MILAAGTAARRASRQLGNVQQRREVEAGRLPVLDRGGGLQQLGVADRLVQRAEPELGQVLADLLGQELEEVDHELRLPGKALPQLGFWVAIPTGQVSRWQTRIRRSQPPRAER